MIRQEDIKRQIHNYFIVHPELNVDDVLNLMYMDDKITASEYEHLRTK